MKTLRSLCILAALAAFTPMAHAGVFGVVKHLAGDGWHSVKYVAVSGWHVTKHAAGDLKTVVW